MITGVASALGVVRVVLNDRYNNHIHVSWCTFLMDLFLVYISVYVPD